MGLKADQTRSGSSMKACLGQKTATNTPSSSMLREASCLIALRISPKKIRELQLKRKSFNLKTICEFFYHLKFQQDFHNGPRKRRRDG